MRDKKDIALQKGMIQDVHPYLQPDGSFRASGGMRLVSNDGNSYALESIRGNRLSFILNPNFLPIAFLECVDRFIIWSTNRHISGVGTGEIGEVFINPLSKLGNYIPLYVHQGLNFSEQKQIEAHNNLETPQIGRAYWNDHNNPPRQLNYLNSLFTTYIFSGSLVASQQYMVVQGTVTHNAINYGPNEVAGTVFTAVNTLWTGVGLVINYFPISRLNQIMYDPKAQIDFVEYLNPGGVLSGNWQYIVQFEADGYRTPFTLATTPMHVTGPTLPGVTATSYQAKQGASPTTNSQIGVRLQISGIDPSFTKMRVAAIHALNNTLTDLIQVIYYGPVTGTSQIVDHMGNENIGTLLLADLLATNPAILRAKTSTSSKLRHVIANYDTVPDVDFDPSGATIALNLYDLPSDAQGFARPDSGSIASGQQLSGHLMAPAAGVPSGRIITGGRYLVSGDFVTYNAVVYNPGQVFIGLSGAYTYTPNSGATLIQACITIEKYTGVLEYHIIEDDYYDYKGMAVSRYLQGYWRSETYRFGIMLWDIFGNPKFVRWMADFQMPNQEDLAGNYVLCKEYDSGKYTVLTAMGIRVSGIDIGAIATAAGVSVAQLGTLYSGFSIVRAARDAQVLAQGILYPCSYESTATPPIVRPTSAGQLGNDKYATAHLRKSNNYALYSPEYQMHFYGSNIQFNKDDRLTIVTYYDDSFRAVGGGGTLETTNYHFYEKMYTRTVGPTAPGQYTVIDEAHCGQLTDGEIGVSLGTGELYYQDTYTSGAWVGGGSVERNCKGGIVVIVATLTPDTNFTPNGFGNNDPFVSYRPIVNHVRIKSSLYGGQSDSAKANTQYQSCGHFQPFDSTFLTYVQGNSGKADNIEVWGGDCFLAQHDFARMTSDLGAANYISFGTFFPVESNINIALRAGRHLSNQRSYDGGTNPFGIAFAGGGAAAGLESWTYYSTFSYQEDQILYPGRPEGFMQVTSFLYRSIYSNQKYPGELIDNFRIFLPNNFRDVNGWAGQINAIRNKKGYILYWQDHASGFMPINERVTVPASLGQPVVLGDGGVMDRFDEVEKFHGCQHQWSLVETEDGFSYWDQRFKCICVIDVNQNAVELSTIKGMLSYFRDFVPDGMKNIDNPVSSGGVFGVSNTHFKEVIFIFRVYQGELLTPFFAAIAFDAMNKEFIGFYPMRQGTGIDFGNQLFSSWDGPYSPLTRNFNYNVGDITTYLDTNYVCLIAYTSPSVIVNPPPAPNWVATSSRNQVYIHNDSCDVAKFHGVVYDSYYTPVINPKNGYGNNFDTVEIGADQPFFDTVTFTNENQTAIDTNVSNNEYYEFRYQMWLHNVPFDTNGGRMIGKYLQIEYRKDNKLNGNPTVSKNEVVKLLYLKGINRETR